MRFKGLFPGILLIFLAHISTAQLPNQAFQKPAGVKAEHAGELRLGIRTFGFFKNNEYFNKIADGYTLFGYHFMPSLQYFPSDKVKIEAGALVWKDFGNFRLTRVQPTLTVTYQNNEHTLLFGTLNGNLNLNYIEPLWDFERQLLVPLQHGVQYVYKSPGFDFQAFIDWQVMQYPFDTRQEQVGGGFSSDLRIAGRSITTSAAKAIKIKTTEPGYEFYESDSLDVEVKKKQKRKKSSYLVDASVNIDKLTLLTMPIQFTGMHKGGQIDVNDKPLTTIFNGAVGLELSKRFRKTVYARNETFKGSFLKNIYTKNYFVAFDDYSFEHQLPFQGGSGIYLNAGADTRFGEFMASYWKGNGYISEFGGRLYQSVGTTVKKPGFIDRQRQLLIIRHLSTYHLTEGVTLSNRFEPFIDLNRGTFEFSTGFYVHFDTDFFLGTPKRVNPNR